MSTEQLLVESIRAIQRVTGETQGQLAEVIGVQIANMNKRMNGRIHFTFAELDKLAKHWNLVPTELLIGAAFAQQSMITQHLSNTPVQRTGSVAA